MDETNFRFLVLNREKAAYHKSGKRPYAVISITDPCSYDNSFIEDKNRKDVLHLKFSDFDVERYPGMKKYIGTKKGDERYNELIVIFSNEHAKEIYDFYCKHKDSVGYFLVHCEAGISRSPAVAAALSLFESGNDEYFFNEFLPNRYVYRTILNYLDESGEMWKRVQLFRSRK